MKSMLLSMYRTPLTARSSKQVHKNIMYKELFLSVPLLQVELIVLFLLLLPPPTTWLTSPQELAPPPTKLITGHSAFRYICISFSQNGGRGGVGAYQMLFLKTNSNQSHVSLFGANYETVPHYCCFFSFKKVPRP